MMHQQDIFKKIGTILTELNEQYEFLAQNPQQLYDFEVELFQANANFLSDHVRIIQKLSLANQKQAAAEMPQIVEEEQTENVENSTPAVSYPNDDVHLDDLYLEEVATAEEEESRIDVAPEQEIVDEEEIHADIAKSNIERDFFKPDQGAKSFEFEFGDHSVDHQLDYESKSVEEIFDRPLSAAEQEILAQKKKIHDKEEQEAQLATHVVIPEDDEIGPEPFLISHDEEVNVQEDIVAHTESITEVIQFEEPEQEQEIIEVEEAEEEISSVETESVVEEIKEEPIVVAPLVEKSFFTPEASPVSPVEEPMVSQKPTMSLNELMAKGNAVNQDDQIKTPITDLKTAITLNEKLLFTKDLFKGYNLAYSEAIDIVNKMNSFDAADGFLKSNYALKNDWTSRQATVDQFYELLNRRFLKD